MSLYFLRLDPAENLLTPRWGHIRPAQGFILNLLRLHPTLHITFLISGIVGLKAAKDKLRYNVSPDIEARLRTIHLTTGPKEGAALTSSMEYVQGTWSSYRWLRGDVHEDLEGEPCQNCCKATLSTSWFRENR